MRDGSTRKLDAEASDASVSDYLARWQVSIVTVDGGVAGEEFVIEGGRTVLGRGPGADLCFADPAMSKEHAALEFAGEGFRIRDLGSTNGLRLNDSETRTGDLKHGDRFQLGEHVFRFLVEARRREPRTYVLPEA